MQSCNTPTSTDSSQRFSEIFFRGSQGFADLDLIWNGDSRACKKNLRAIRPLRSTLHLYLQPLLFGRRKRLPPPLEDVQLSGGELGSRLGARNTIGFCQSA